MADDAKGQDAEDAVDYGEYGAETYTEDGPTEDATADAGGDVDAEFAELQEMVSKMEEDNKTIIAASTQAATDAASTAAAKASLEAKIRDRDERSVFVSNVDFSATAEEVAAFFSSCGVVAQATILRDKFTGHPKGFAYVEFKDKAAVENAIILDNTDFKSRTVRVILKRTNLPPHMLRASRGRGRGGPIKRGGGYAAAAFHRGGFRGGRGGFRGGPYRGRGGRGRGQ